MLTQRQVQFGENIRRELSEFMIENEMIVSGTFVSIIKAIPSADLGYIKVYFRIIDTKYINDVKKVLDLMSDDIGTFLLKKLRLKSRPKFVFFYDDTFEEGEKIKKIFDSIDKK